MRRLFSLRCPNGKLEPGKCTWLLHPPEVAVEGGAEVVEVVEAEPCLQLLIPRETPNREPQTHIHNHRYTDIQGH